MLIADSNVCYSNYIETLPDTDSETSINCNSNSKNVKSTQNVILEMSNQEAQEILSRNRQKFVQTGQKCQFLSPLDELRLG